tara:strand:+ start:2372 stop:3070 length:699 start_codon:yes stop_codon:yes gene_type:complete
MKKKFKKNKSFSITFGCPLCGSSSDLFFVDDREYWLCRTCALIFVPSAYHVSREDEVCRYLEHENTLQNEGYVKMFQEKIDLVQFACPKVVRILDYGCGYEPVLKNLLSREGYKVDAFDPNFFPHGQSQKRYDLVISTETFEHFREPIREIKRIVSLLDYEGYVAIMSQFYPKENGGPSQAVFEKWYYKRDPTHIAFYTLETFEWIGQAFNMEIILNNERDFVIFRQRILAA